MEIKEIFDENEIKKVICEKEIFERINDDYTETIDNFKIPFFNYRYFAGYIDNCIIGVMVYNYNKDKIFCHFQVLKQFRSKFAYKFAKLSLIKDLDIYIEVPVVFKDVIRFSKAFGFKEKKLYKNNYIKNGKKSDILLLKRRGKKWD
jgi:hypothetical protein